MFIQYTAWLAHWRLCCMYSVHFGGRRNLARVWMCKCGFTENLDSEVCVGGLTEKWGEGVWLGFLNSRNSWFSAATQNQLLTSVQRAGQLLLKSPKQTQMKQETQASKKMPADAPCLLKVDNCLLLHLTWIWSFSVFLGLRKLHSDDPNWLWRDNIHVPFTGFMMTLLLLYFSN